MSERKRKPIPGSEPFEALGETWLLAPIGPGVRDAFAQQVRVRARKQLYADRAWMEPDHYRAEEKALSGQIAAGAYEWGPPRDKGGVGMGEAVLATFETELGKVRLTQMLLEPNHGEVPLGRVAEIIADSLFPWLYAFRAALGLPPPDEEPQEDADPNAIAPASPASAPESSTTTTASTS